MAVSSQTDGFGALKRLRDCALLPCLLAAPVLSAATIEEGDITSSLGPTFFVDDTTLGGSDIDIGHNTTVSFIRLFNGQLAANQGPTRVVLTGFGFATHTSTTANDATTINVAFTYLGADEAVGGGDDVPIGNATGDFVFSGGKEYTFRFDSPLTADLNITGTRFHIQVTPVNANHTALPDTALKLKTGALASEPSVSGPKLSVAGLSRPLISPGRVNLAKFQPVTATSTAGQRLASYLTDGVAGNDNRWQGSGSTWQSAVIDFPFPVEAGSAQVFTGVDDTNPIATYVVQFWNGTAWTNIDGANVSGNTSTERNLVFTNPVTASSFRFLSSETNLRVKELALYPPNGPGGFQIGSDVTLNLACGRPAVASASTPGNFALEAVDGRAHTGSFWQTATAGVNTLDIDLRVSTKIGSAHLYSGAGTSPPLADFVLKFWNGSSWQNIPGGTVTGNTTSDLVISFTPVTTSQIRLEFTNPGTTSIRELCVFPANAGNTGYPIGTNIINSGAIGGHETYNDSFQLITNTGAARSMSVPSSGQPALDPNGLTFGQSHYQLLLNHSTGTYRLRNRASGECLSGAQLDKTPGLALLDAPYSAMPHQDWILDPMGGGNFRFINQWSGLAIDTQGGATAPGTLLVQNTASHSSSQLWQISRHSWAPKKGIGHSLLSIPLGADWVYNWGRLINQPLPADAPFFPMQWGNSSWDIGSAQGPLWQEYTRWRTRGDGVHLLGFNEPDRADQSNMSLSQVITAWPRLQELDLPLVSPAPGTASWLDSFYIQADALGYRVDATAVHTYPGPSGGNSDDLHNFVNSAYTFNGRNRPVWLTEFSFVDWGKNQSWSEEDNYNCLAEFIWRAEGNDKLRKYALFIFTENTEWPQPANSWSAVSPAPRSNSYDAAGNMTAFGKLYAAWDSDTTIRTDKTYMVHNRGLRKRMANAATTNTAPGGRTIRTDGPIVNWTLVSAGTTNRYYLVSSIDGRRLSYTANPTTNPNNDPALAAPGTTGTAVEWSLAESEHGWHYLGHPATNTRLRLVSYNTSNTVSDYQMVSSGTTDHNTQWRFIVPLPSNTAPSLAAIPSLSANEGSPLTFTASATDDSVPSSNIYFSLVNAPSGASINSLTGVFTWTPSESQGPGTYNFTVRASDGYLSADQAVSVTVNEVNIAPVLASIPAQTVNEGALLTFTASATDADLPSPTLVYSLIGAPDGAAIGSGSGIFSWTPAENQGPGVFNFTVRVSDGNLSHDRNVTVTVNEVNVAPVPGSIPAQTVTQGSLLSFTVSATDADLPANTLNFSLVGAPDGAAIDSINGLFTWTPTNVQGPGVFNFSVRVGDGTVTQDQPVSVTVHRINTPPVLSPIPPQTVVEGSPLNFTASATDADLPPDPLAFSLINAPSGATIHPGTGAFSWTPDQTQGPASYLFTIRVSDGTLTHDQPVTVSVLEDGGSDVLDTWILSGQSNAEGYAITQNPVPGLTPSSTLATIGRSDLNVVHNNVRMFQGATDLSGGITTSAGLSLPPRDTWHTATSYEGLAYDWGTGRGNESGRRFGPELAFGFDVQAMLASPIAIIKYARGNSSIAPSTAQSGGVWRDFDPSDGGRLNQYDKLVSTIQGAVDNLPAGQVLKVRGVLWMQGEGDATSSAFASAYQSNLGEFISSLRNDIGSIAAGSSGRMTASATSWNQLDVFVGTILNTSANRQTVINAQNAVAAADPNVFTVNGTTGLSTLSVDDWGGSGIHYDTAGQVLLGERFADAAISRINSGVQVSETGGSTSVSEGGAPDAYTVSLTRAPSADVTITITPDSQVAVSPATLTFTAANWNTPQNVTVTAVDDAIIESTHSGAISHGLTSDDPSFGGLPVDGVTVSITDNDFNTAPVLTTIPPQTASVGSPLTFTATATDNDLPANALTFTLIGAPNGAGIVASTGVFSWTPTPAQTGVFQFTVLVSDGALTDGQLVTITVADPLPSAAADADQDGLSDLLEHAFVTDAGVPNGNPFKVTGASAGTATLSFPWRWQATNITWRIRHGQDPSNTAAWPVVEPLATQATRDGVIDHMTITLPMNHPGRGFYILEVIGN
jgi:hypothetical protein